MHKASKYKHIYHFCTAIIYSLILYSTPLYAEKHNSELSDSLVKTSRFLMIHKSINYQQDTIEKRWGSVCGTEFMTQIDNIQLYIEHTIKNDISKEKYLSVLADFLSTIDNPNTRPYFVSNRYLSVLQFYPAVIDYSENHRLAELLDQDKLLSLKSIRLFKKEKEAEPFLRKFADINPDEVFRNVNEFADMSYASSVILYCSGVAPLSAERYLGGFNSVNRIIKTSDLFLAKTLSRIDSVKTNRHNRFLYLDYFMRDTFPNYDLANVQSNKIFFFKELAALHFKNGVWGKFSIDRELSLLSSDIIREINYYYSNGYKNNVESILSSFTPEELYLVFLYGYQDATIYSFSSYIELLKYKSTAKFGSDFYNSISSEDLINFLTVTEKFGKTNDILSLTSDDYKNKLLQNLSIDEPNEGVAIDKYLDAFIKTEIEKTEVIKPEIKKTEISKIEIVKTESIKPEIVSTEIKKTEIEKTEIEKTEMKAVPVSSLSDANIQKDIVLNNTYEVKNTTLSIPEQETKLTLNSTVSKGTIIQDEEVFLSTKSNSIDQKEISIRQPSAIIPPITIRVTAEERTTYTILKNPDESLSNLTYVNSFLDSKFAKQTLLTLANIHPEMIFKYTKNIQSKYWIKDVLEVAAHQSPTCYKRYLPNENHPANWILQYSKDSMVLEMKAIYKTLGYRSNAYCLMDDIMCNRKTAAQCDSITKDVEQNFIEMTNIVVGKENLIGRNSLEADLQNLCLLKVRKINDINNVADEVRFASIKDFSAQQLYVLMIFGEDELFKSSFNGVFQRFMSKIPSGGAYRFLQQIHCLHFRTFLKICSNFGRTEEFLNSMSPDERLQLIALMTKNLEQQKYNPSEVIFVAEAIPGFTNLNDRAVINTTIKSEFERLQKTNDGTGMLLYGLLASIIQKDVVAEKDWFVQISKSFELPVIDRIQISSLVDANKQCIQQHYFYDDDDGRSSFSNFIASFKALSNYTIENHETYVQIYSTSGINKIMIFANKPEYEQNGINEIDKFFKANHWEPLVVVHRGHSFHTEKTLSVIPANTKLLVVGSCGGYYKLPIAIERAPGAHIVSTKQIGTMRVNDPIIKLICEKIRLNQDVVWSDFWKEIEIQVGKTPMFYDYVPPNKNLGSLFLNAYYKAIDLSSLKDLD